MTNNSELRRRKTRDHQNGRPAPNKRRKDVKASTLHRSFLCLVLSGTILTAFVLLYIDTIPWHLGHRVADQIAEKFGYSRLVHAVVMDAGSTGSRVLAYTFHESFFGSRLVLDKELFKYNKPGLSSFADSPEKGAQKIAELLEEAKREIPQEYWSKTPLILKATAGLRLLPAAKAENLLNSVREVLNKAPFKTDEKSVEIMDGTDEGIFSWFTVNFLLELIHASPTQTVAALDLGGGSTQVTFAAQTPASLSEKDNIHHAASPNGPIPVYTHSFLGLGLMAARKALFTLNQPNSTHVISECVNHIIKDRRFHFGGADYFVSGPQEKYATSKSIGNPKYNVVQDIPVVDFKKCSDLVTNYVVKLSKPPEELPTKKIFAFSYYFDRAIEVGLIDETTGGQVTINDFKNSAERSCHEANEEQPFMCLDLTFIWILLEKGLGLQGDTKIYLYKKITGHEISWALGAAYDVLRG